jgi:hypothetical protein
MALRFFVSLRILFRFTAISAFLASRRWSCQHSSSSPEYYFFSSGEPGIVGSAIRTLSGFTKKFPQKKSPDDQNRVPV